MKLQLLAANLQCIARLKKSIDTYTTQKDTLSKAAKQYADAFKKHIEENVVRYCDYSVIKETGEVRKQKYKLVNCCREITRYYAETFRPAEDLF